LAKSCEVQTYLPIPEPEESRAKMVDAENPKRLDYPVVPHPEPSRLKIPEKDIT
tara:strand:- start:15160 stop:15321 length:162 start_codon:yes stop_codon:yes gene_type:complete